MNFLLDTCVISELVAKQPNLNVIQWIDSIDEERLHLSVITIGEIRKGIVKLPNLSRKQVLENWLFDDLLVRFAGRIALIDTQVMLQWGQITGVLEKKGKRMPAIDSLIAAIAITGNFTLITRNEDDFRMIEIPLLNPWS